MEVDRRLHDDREAAASSAPEEGAGRTDTPAVVAGPSEVGNLIEAIVDERVGYRVKLDALTRLNGLSPEQMYGHARHLLQALAKSQEEVSQTLSAEIASLTIRAFDAGGEGVNQGDETRAQEGIANAFLDCLDLLLDFNAAKKNPYLFKVQRHILSRLFTGCTTHPFLLTLFVYACISSSDCAAQRPSIEPELALFEMLGADFLGWDKRMCDFFCLSGAFLPFIAIHLAYPPSEREKAASLSVAVAVIRATRNAPPYDVPAVFGAVPQIARLGDVALLPLFYPLLQQSASEKPIWLREEVIDFIRSMRDMRALPLLLYEAMRRENDGEKAQFAIGAMHLSPSQALTWISPLLSALRRKMQEADDRDDRVAAANALATLIRALLKSRDPRATFMAYSFWFNERSEEFIQAMLQDPPIDSVSMGLGAGLALQGALGWAFSALAAENLNLDEASRNAADRLVEQLLSRCTHHPPHAAVSGEASLASAKVATPPSAPLPLPKRPLPLPKR